jgi:Type IV secretion system pilin
MIAHAATSIASNPTVARLVGKINDAIITPIIALAFALAILIFTWGIFQYFVQSTDPEKRAEGAKHILWGVVGMFIMVSAYGIIRLIANSIGADQPY